MSKLSELSAAVAELKHCGEVLIGISDSLAALFSANENVPTTEVPKVKNPAPTEKPVTLEAVRAVLAVKSQAGHTAKVRELLEKHGATKLSEIDPSKYPMLLKDAEVIGNG